MAKNNEGDRVPLPPYVSFKTLEGVIRKFKETTVPGVVDTSVLRTYANSVARQVIVAMKYLGLIEEDGKRTDRLIRLRNAYGTPDWQPALTETFYDAYRPLIGGLDLESASYAQLADQFRRQGAEGAVLQKCLAFFVAAARAADLTISPHILNRPRARPERRGRPKKATEEVTFSDSVQTVTEQAGGTARFSFPIPGKPAVTMFLPVELDGPDWEMVDAMVRAYIERRKKA
jgi:hypothetical protein